MTEREHTYQITTMLEKLGLTEKARSYLTRLCHQRIREIKWVAENEGRGSELGRLNIKYADFFRFIAPILSKPQSMRISQIYKKVQKIWLK